METFLDKINPITAIIIKLQKTVNLDQAIAIAKQEEKKIRDKKGQNFKNPKFNVDKKQFKKDNNQYKKTKQSININENKKKVHFNESTDNEDSTESDEDNTSDSEPDQNFLTDLETEDET